MEMSTAPIHIYSILTLHQLYIYNNDYIYIEWYSNDLLNRYNHIKTNTNDVEFNLIRKEMEEIDTEIQKAESELTWNSEGKMLE